MILIQDGRGKLAIERYTSRGSEPSIMINHTAATPATIHLAVDAEEARALAEALINFADEQDERHTQ